MIKQFCILMVIVMCGMLVNCASVKNQNVQINIDEAIRLSMGNELDFEGQENLLKNVSKNVTQTDVVGFGGGLFFGCGSASSTVVRSIVWEYATAEAQYYYAKQKLAALKNEGNGWILSRSEQTKSYRRNRTLIRQKGGQLVFYVLNQNGGWRYIFIADPGI